MSDYFGVKIPFAEHCRIIALSHEPGHVRLSVQVAEEHKNNLGIAHGGVILTLLDIALGSAARTAAGVPVMTIDMHSAFLSPGRGELFGEGRVLRQGRSLIFSEGEVRDAEGNLVAKGSGVFKTAKPHEADK